MFDRRFGFQYASVLQMGCPTASWSVPPRPGEIAHDCKREFVNRVWDLGMLPCGIRGLSASFLQLYFARDTIFVRLGRSPFTILLRDLVKPSLVRRVLKKVEVCVELFFRQT